MSRKNHVDFALKKGIILLRIQVIRFLGAKRVTFFSTEIQIGIQWALLWSSAELCNSPRGLFWGLNQSPATGWVTKALL